jgi:AraC-like DNA-binding protein
MPGEKAEGIMNRVADLMEKESPYLNPDLSLPELAAMTGIPRGDLSTAINASGGGNFYDYVNSYRLKRVRKLLVDNPDMSVIEAAFSCGFNSKSTFNEAFKRDTGLTPSEYRRRRGVN